MSLSASARLRIDSIGIVLADLARIYLARNLRIIEETGSIRANTSPEYVRRPALRELVEDRMISRSTQRPAEFLPKVTPVRAVMYSNAELTVGKDATFGYPAAGAKRVAFSTESTSDVTQRTQFVRVTTKDA